MNRSYFEHDYILTQQNSINWFSTGSHTWNKTKVKNIQYVFRVMVKDLPCRFGCTNFPLLEYIATLVTKDNRPFVLAKIPLIWLHFYSTWTMVLFLIFFLPNAILGETSETSFMNEPPVRSQLSLLSNEGASFEQLKPSAVMCCYVWWSLCVSECFHTAH